MIDLIGVSKTYRVKGVSKRIFNDITFSFPKDRNIAILGPNGSGKSTLLRLIAGSEPPDSGQIIRHGRLSWPLAFSGGFNGTMTGLENIRFVARIYGQDPRRISDYVEEFSELGASLRLPVRGYSTGMRARLALGLSLAFDFDTYLIDEIIGVGDAAFRRKSLGAFRGKIPNAQLIMASHSMAHIREFCHCGLLLAPSGISFHDEIESLVAAYEATAHA